MNYTHLAQTEESYYRRILPWAVWLCAGFFYLYQFIVRILPSIIAQDLMRELSLQACSLGTLVSFYYYGYTGMQIPVGLILDHYGVRIPLTIAILFCGTGGFIFAVTDSLTMMSVGRLLVGVGSAFGFLSCVKAASLWFSPNRLAFLVGLSMLLGTTGASGGAPLAALVTYIGWRDATMLLGYVGIGLALIVWLVVRDRKEVSITFEDTDKKKERGAVLKTIKPILKNPQTYVFGLYGALMYVILSGFADLWGVHYICTVYNVDRTVAAGSVSLFYIGIGAGSPVCSWLADLLQSHKRLMKLGAILLGLIFTVVIYFPYFPFSFTYGLFFLCGVCASTQFLAFVSVCEINANDASATASGIHNMMCMMNGILFLPIIGYLLDLSWDGTLSSDGGPLYTQFDYQVALGIIPVSILIAIGLIFLMKETYQK